MYMLVVAIFLELAGGLLLIFDSSLGAFLLVCLLEFTVLCKHATADEVC